MAEGLGLSGIAIEGEGMTVAEYQLALCELMKECPYRPPGYGELLGYNHMNCLTCHGTLEVPLLEGVREKCLIAICHYLPDVPGWHENKDCPVCQGRGWVPSKDPFKYFLAVRQWDLPHLDYIEICWSIFRGELDTYKTMVEALEWNAKVLGVKDV